MTIVVLRDLRLILSTHGFMQKKAERGRFLPDECIRLRRQLLPNFLLGVHRDCTQIAKTALMGSLRSLQDLGGYDMPVSHLLHLCSPLLDSCRKKCAQTFAVCTVQVNPFFCLPTAQIHPLGQC